MTSIRKAVVIGLDCAEPSLVFDQWRDELPNLSALMQRGRWGNLESCMPPITVPAWSCMATGRDPGTLGVYGFRNRADHSYENLRIATNLEVREPRVWDRLSAAGRDSIIVGVPQTFPITQRPRGALVTCFLTPSIESEYTSPPELKSEIAGVVGEYMVDVAGFRTDDKRWLLDQIYEMTARRFKLCRHFLTTHPWDLFWMVEMGTDRIHHGFWQFMDRRHHRHTPGNEFENAIREYYRFIDARIGELLALINPAETLVAIVSDHGAKRMDGGLCFNDWLIREGLLVMKTPVTERRKFEFKDVDWPRTQAWGEGGYYGRLFINKAGREPHGVVAPADYEALRNRLIAKIEALRDHEGRPMGNRAYRPEAIYQSVNGVPPDLIVIFGDMHWRSVGTIGNPDIYTFENDTGPDDANHAQQGMYIMSHASLRPGRHDASIYDIAPTLHAALGLSGLENARGRSLLL
ncbi:MAG: alkaline phosphatase family protein [Phycisphaerales bacterium]|nr:alkaline phosphatase family protein [Phycisphaerales bacterium]